MITERMLGLTSGICARSVRPSIWGMLMSETTISMLWSSFQPLERLHAVLGEDELVAAGPNGAAHALQYEWLDVRLVVYHQDLEGLLCQRLRVLWNSAKLLGLRAASVGSRGPATPSSLQRSDGLFLRVVGRDDLVEATDAEDLSDRFRERADSETSVLPL